uniref:Uncharacterized protein n=1 Tax=Fagus sylvatica TaxID=28930 RepID=A0A2N9HZS4_FAGSY
MRLFLVSSFILRNGLHTSIFFLELFDSFYQLTLKSTASLVSAPASDLFGSTSRFGSLGGGCGGSCPCTLVADSTREFSVWTETSLQLPLCRSLGGMILEALTFFLEVLISTPQWSRQKCQVLCMSLLTLASTNQSLCLPADLMIVVQWFPKSRGLLPSTKPHSSSQNHIRRVATFTRSGPWGYSLSPFGTGMDMGYEKVCCVNTVRIHGFRWNRRVKVSWKMLEQFENGRPACSCHI